LFKLRPSPPPRRGGPRPSPVRNASTNAPLSTDHYRRPRDLKQHGRGHRLDQGSSASLSVPPRRHDSGRRATDQAQSCDPFDLTRYRWPTPGYHLGTETTVTVWSASHPRLPLDDQAVRLLGPTRRPSSPALADNFAALRAGDYISACPDSSTTGTRMPGTRGPCTLCRPGRADGRILPSRLFPTHSVAALFACRICSDKTAHPRPRRFDDATKSRRSGLHKFDDFRLTMPDSGYAQEPTASAQRRGLSDSPFSQLRTSSATVFGRSPPGQATTCSTAPSSPDTPSHALNPNSPICNELTPKPLSRSCGSHATPMPAPSVRSPGDEHGCLASDE